MEEQPEPAPHVEHDLPLLPNDVPVPLPDLPLHLTVSTPAQFKALADPLRSRMLDIMRHQPVTAKQIADRLQVSPGAVGHHLRVLQDASLIQLVARRLVRGIVAKYYARSARVYLFASQSQSDDVTPSSLQFLHEAHRHLAEAIDADGEQEVCVSSGFPRARIAPQRAQEYAERLKALVNEFIAEPHDPAGQLYALSYSLFREPPSLQAIESEPV